MLRTLQGMSAPLARTPRAHRRVPSFLAGLGILLLLLLMPLLGACTGGGASGSGDGATPAPAGVRATLDRFRAAVAADRHAEEWALLSPSFKRRLEARVGGRVTLEDYRRARAEVHARAAGELIDLTRGRPAGEQMLGPGAALVDWRTDGRVMDVRMVRLSRWVLRVTGTSARYVGYVASPGEAPRRAEDGSLTLLVPATPGGDPAPRTFQGAEIAAYGVESAWLVDDVGALGERLAAALGPAAR